jgi:hypothetical protein
VWDTTPNIGSFDRRSDGMSREIFGGGAMKRVILPLLAAIATILVVAAVAGGHGPKGHHTLELVGTSASFDFVDVDPKQANPETEAPTPGDAFLLSETLTMNGRDFGSVYAHCTFVTAEVSQCLATLDLPNGQITVQGVTRDEPDFTLAITGGTGAYTGAGGTLTGHERETRKRPFHSHGRGALA